jgi:hypothetical protein
MQATRYNRTEFVPSHLLQGDLIFMLGIEGRMVTSRRRRGLLLAAEGGKVGGASQSWQR